MRRWLVGSIVAVSTLTASASFAQVLGDTSGLSASALLGYANKNLNLGFGARLGYTLPVVPVYLGGTFVYHLGTSEGGSSIKQYYYGVEGGYTFGLGVVALRPFLGFGSFNTSSSGSLCALGQCFTADGSTSDVAIWPGVDVLLPVGPVFVGGDARFLHARDTDAFAIYATAGLKF